LSLAPRYSARHGTASGTFIAICFNELKQAAAQAIVAAWPDP